MKQILILVLSVLVLLAGLGFSLLNADKVVLNYYFGQAHLPLSIMLVSALVIGALLGVMVSLGAIFKARREMRRLRKELKLKEKEIIGLRALPEQDR
ncbi:MAG: LapA family protein [Pseudomonadota bacterium]